MTPPGETNMRVLIAAIVAAQDMIDAIDHPSLGPVDRALSSALHEAISLRWETPADSAGGEYHESPAYLGEAALPLDEAAR